MRTAGIMLIGLALAGCAGMPPSSCPVGQTSMRTAQLVFGPGGGAPPISEAEFRAFVDQEIRPRFPDGLTVLDGGHKWRGEENRLIREASKVVMIVLTKGRDASGRIEAVRAAYSAKFHQDSNLLVTNAACFAL